MISRLCILLFLAAGMASALRDLDNGVGRELLQTPNATDCARSVKNCLKCRYQFVRGTVTKAICLQCDTGYAVKQAGRSCWCAPGYYRNEPVAAPDTCTQCGLGYYCTGAKATQASGDAHVKCGEHKITTSDHASSDRECLAQPGYGWAAGDAIECPVGFYNPGNNNRRCTRCPGGLTTNDTQAQSSQYCVAPEGYYYLRGRSVACARGTWKSQIGNTDCTECPEGFSTVQGEVGKMNSADCNYLLPGYAADASLSVGTDAATLCPEGWYRTGDAEYTGAKIDCVQCPAGMSTLPNITGASSPDNCLVKPGYGWVSGPTPGTTQECPVGSYNPGWNREPCIDCGLGGITTDAKLSTSAEDCKTPAGYGTNRTADGLTLFAFECPVDTYGRPNDTYGLVDVECTKCPEHTSTAAAGQTGGDSCKTDPGYGWYDGQVLQCEYATYNGGDNQNPCTECKQGYNTSAPGSTTVAACEIAAGWVPDAAASGIEPCLRGYFKDWLGAVPDTCTQCPNGTTTTITQAATEESDCDACRPGFGQASIDLENPECAMCVSGKYSPGFVKGGAGCSDCPHPYNFTGKMVSRMGISTPEDCVGEFPTDAAAGLENDQDWDVIWMNESLTVQTGDLTACQAGCSTSNKCQYFEYRSWLAADARCYYKLSTADIADPVTLAADKSYILFEVGAGLYATYLHDTSDDVHFIGETLDATTFTDRQAAVEACNAQAACIGITKKASVATWRLFKGTKFEAAVGKVRVVGEAINPWISEPSSTPNRR